MHMSIIGSSQTSFFLSANLVVIISEGCLVAVSFSLARQPACLVPLLHFLFYNSMTSPVSAKPGAGISRSKSLPWFQSKIGSSLTPASRKLLEEYSGVSAVEVEAHVYRIVSVLTMDDFYVVYFNLPLSPTA